MTLGAVVAGGVGGKVIGDVLQRGTKIPRDDQANAEAFRDLWCLYGEATTHILHHMETVTPRMADIDLSHNSVQNRVQGEDVITAANGVRTIATMTSARLVFVAREGFVAHIKGIEVDVLDAPERDGDITVTVDSTGRRLQNIPKLTYTRPIMVDRDARVAITIANTSGTDITVSYAILGWLRAQGRPTLTGSKGYGG